jgi:GntR family transcriptional regulator
MTARHQQVADDLRRLITSGEYATGERLPSEARLSDRYRVSTPTLRDALELLRTEGLIEKFQGRGNFVRQPADRLTYPSGRTADLQVIVSSAELTATSDVAARLRMPPGDPVTEYVCLSHRADSPQSLAHVYVPRAAAHVGTPKANLSPWGDDFTGTAAATETTSNDQVTARFPTEAEAQLLRIATRTPVLAVHRIITADDGQVLAYVLLVLPGDRAQVAFATRTQPEPAGKTQQMGTPAGGSDER